MASRTTNTPTEMIHSATAAVAAAAANARRRTARFMKTHELMKTEKKLLRSCQQVVLLNDKIRGLTKRYRAARAEGFKSMRYSVRVRLAVVEGVRNMYYEYARDRAEEVAELRKELYDQTVEIITGSDDDDSYDDEEVGVYYQNSEESDGSEGEEMVTEDDAV